MTGSPPSATPDRPGSPAPSGKDDPYAVMRPRWGRNVARWAAAVVMAGFIFGAVAIPGPEQQKGAWGIGDRLLILLSGLVIAWLLWRFGTIEAQPSQQGLVVRNLILTRRLEWAEIVRVQFGGGAPWASLDLVDTETLAVMAVQKADGAHGRALAARLAALVQVHAQAAEPGSRRGRNGPGSADPADPAAP